MVVVGFSGFLAVFWRWFFLTFRQSLWPASSEDSKLCSGVVWLGCGVFLALRWDDYKKHKTLPKLKVAKLVSLERQIHSVGVARLKVLSQTLSKHASEDGRAGKRTSLNNFRCSVTETLLQISVFVKQCSALQVLYKNHGYVFSLNMVDGKTVEKEWGTLPLFELWTQELEQQRPQESEKAVLERWRSSCLINVWWRGFH